MINDTPLVVITFVAQHINCVKDRTGKIVDGYEVRRVAMRSQTLSCAELVLVLLCGVLCGTQSDIKHAYYSWVLRRDFENPFFDWKIVEMVSHRMQALV